MSTNQLRRGGGRRDTRDWIDHIIEVASGVTAVGMFGYGFALSYSVLHAIAVAAGLPVWAADVWPLGYEAFMASAALNALAEQRRRRHLTQWWQRVPWYPWTLTGLTAGASLLLNWFHPAIPLDPPPGWLRSLVYGLPPLVAVFAWHLFLQRVAHRRPAPPRATPAADAGDPSRPDQAAVPEAPARNGGPAPATTPTRRPSAPVLAGPPPTPAAEAGNGRYPAGPGKVAPWSVSAVTTGAVGPAAAAGGSGSGERDADARMRAYWAAERAAGRTPSGAELDRVCGRDPRNGAGRKARARYLREEAAGHFHAPKPVPVPDSEPATAAPDPGPGVGPVPADGPAASVPVPLPAPSGRPGGG